MPEGCDLCRSKGRPPTAVLDELHMQCEVCGCFGKPRALAGYCYCGARNWENTAPPVHVPARWSPEATAPSSFQPVPHVPSLAPPYPFSAEPTVPPRAIAAAAWPEGGREPPPSPAPSRAPIRMVSGANTTRKIVDDYEGARMNELLGGIMRGAVILIVGKGGAGKSTATAELMAHASLYWSGQVWWLDADQRDTALVRTCFQTAGFEDLFTEEGRVMLLEERPLRYTWAEAIEATPPDAPLLVVDSLEAWARTQTDQLDLLLGLRTHPAYIKVVISGTNKRGQVSGVEALARAGDATVYAERSEAGEHRLRFDKRRWQPCDAARARGAGIPRPPEPPAAASPSAEAEGAPSASPEPEWPDYSPAFIRQAAGWDSREWGSYLAELRRRNVPRATIEEWRAVVEEYQALEAGEADDAPDPVLDEDDDDDGSGGAPLLH